jgi:hypothetical protein
MRYYHLAQDEEIPRVLRTLSRYLYPSRAFFCAEGSDGESWLGHVKTGFMTQFNSKEGAVLRHDRIIQFITTILPRKAAEANGTVSRGLFVVLLGLDGSGKTILARNLCALAGQQNHFRFARYFHWRPKLLRKALFPLPDFRERRPSSKKKPNALRSMLSVARLSKNLLLTNLAYFFRIKPLLRHNGLVLLDRYYYNYYLDPASVSYYGPKWLVDKARRFFPRPDLIVTLHASPNVLLSRKNELTEAEALSQNAILEQLGLEADHTLKLDASLPAPELARVAMQNITAIVGSRASTALASPSKPSKVLPWLPRFTNFMRTLFSFPRLAVCCLALVLVPMLGFLSISPIKNRARAIADDTLPGLSYAGAANANLAQANRVLMFVLSENADERLQLKKEIENLNQKTTSCLEAYKGTIYSSRDLAQFDELIKRRGEYFKVRERTMALAEHNNRREAGLLYQNALLPAFHRYKDAAERLFEYNVREGRSRGKTILTVCTLTQFAVAGAGVLIFVIGFLAGRSKERARYAFA